MATKATRTLVNRANNLAQLLKRAVDAGQTEGRGLEYAMSISGVLYDFKTKGDLASAAKYLNDHAEQLREHLENIHVLESSMSGDNSVYIDATDDLKYSRNLLFGNYRARAKALENFYYSVQDLSGKIDWRIDGKMPDRALISMVNLLEDARQQAGIINNGLGAVVAMRSALWKKIRARRRMTDNYSFELTK